MLERVGSTARLLLLALLAAPGCETVPEQIDASAGDAARRAADASAGRSGDAGGADAATDGPAHVLSARPDGSDEALASPHDAGVRAASQDGAAGDARAPDAASADAASADATSADAALGTDAALHADTGAPHCSDCCPDGWPRGAASLALTRIAAFTPSPEGVAVCPDGEVFVSVDGPDEIRRVPLDAGAPQLYASLAGIQPAGITCDERGRLFVAGFARRNGSPAPPILMVAGPGAAAVQLPPPAGGPEVVALNGITAVPGAGVFASDTAGVLIRARERTDGSFETSVAAEDLLGANGLTFDPASRKLYVVISFLPPGVVSFQVAADGTLSGRKQETSGDLLTLYDGVAVDAAGELYVADYLGGAVLRVRDERPLAQLSNPASFAFRGGSLLVTSYHLNDPRTEGGLYALQLGVCGPRLWP
jgi:SMP-30/Gluconolactonase/LRE-like region